MADRDALEKLRPVAEETLGGLRADDALRRRILKAAEGEPTRRKPWTVTARMLVPAACGVLIAALGVMRLSETRRLSETAGRSAAPDAFETGFGIGISYFFPVRGLFSVSGIVCSSQ